MKNIYFYYYITLIWRQSFLLLPCKFHFDVTKINILVSIQSCLEVYSRCNVGDKSYSVWIWVRRLRLNRRNLRQIWSLWNVMLEIKSNVYVLWGFHNCLAIRNLIYERYYYLVRFANHKFWVNLSSISEW